MVVRESMSLHGMAIGLNAWQSMEQWAADGCGWALQIRI